MTVTLIRTNVLNERISAMRNDAPKAPNERTNVLNERKQGLLNDAVHGTIALPFQKDAPLIYDTLENRDFLIPEGTYPLRLTWSPRFKKLMPEICDVPGREGIRIHMGTKPEHSEGCVLVSYEALANIKALINRTKKYYENETLYINIRHA